MFLLGKNRMIMCRFAQCLMLPRLLSKQGCKNEQINTVIMFYVVKYKTYWRSLNGNYWNSCTVPNFIDFRTMPTEERSRAVAMVFSGHNVGSVVG
jgi:hypothetical protein